MKILRKILPLAVCFYGGFLSLHLAAHPSSPISRMLGHLEIGQALVVPIVIDSEGRPVSLSREDSEGVKVKPIMVVFEEMREALRSMVERVPHLPPVALRSNKGQKSVSSSIFGEREQTDEIIHGVFIFRKSSFEFFYGNTLDDSMSLIPQDGQSYREILDQFVNFAIGRSGAA